MSDKRDAGSRIGETGGIDPERLRKAKGLLDDAETVLVLTGAGVSAESGVPTFRGEDGLWKSHRPEDLATPWAFQRDPRLVWEWYQWRRDLVGECDPNPAHRALARLALSRPGARIVTQNVDGLHEMATREESGDAPPDPAFPLELHGSLFRVRCTGCGRKDPHRDPVDTESEETLPECSECGALLRPDVVWFGESLDPHVLNAAFRWAEEADLCLVVGTSGVVQPAASLPLTARESGGVVVEVNPEETPLTASAEIHLPGPAGSVLPFLIDP